MNIGAVPRNDVIMVDCQCAGCGEFWRFKAGAEPEEIETCPLCDPACDASKWPVAHVECSGCGWEWSVFAEEIARRRGKTIVHCSRCDGDQRGGHVTWGPIPKGEKKMARTKATNGDGEGRVEIDRFEERLLCEIEDEEIAKKANDLAVTIGERDQVKQRRRAAVATFKDKLTHLDEKIVELGESVRTKTERRNVTCIEYLVERQNKVILVRTDTGAIESERPATPEDRQEPMFAGEGRKGKGKRAKKADSAEAIAE